MQDLYHTCGLDEFRNNPLGKFNPDIYQTCVEVGNPSNGFSHFDNIAGSMISIFQATSGDAGYDVLWRMLQSEPDVFALSFVYFFMIIAMNTFLLLGLFVAVVTGTFARVRLQHGSAFLSHEEDDVLSAYDQSPRKSSRGASRGGGLTTTSEAMATKEGKLIYRPHHAKRGKGQMAMYLNDEKEDEKKKEEEEEKEDEVRMCSQPLY